MKDPLYHVSIRDSNVHLFEVVAGLAQSVERKALNLVVVGSSPTPGVLFYFVAVVIPCGVSGKAKLGLPAVPRSGR